MPTRDKGLHCKGRACIFLCWSSLLPRGREQATDPRAVPVVSLSPTSPHPLLHLLTHTQTQPSPPQRQTSETSSIELCQKNATLQTIPTVARRQYPESICSMITLIWAIQRVSTYMRKLKSVKPPEIPGMGVSVSWQKKNERRAKEIMSQTNTLPGTMPLLQLQTHDRDRDAFHWRLHVSPSHNSPLPQFSQSNTNMCTQAQPTHIHEKQIQPTEGQIFPFSSRLLDFSVPSPLTVSVA